LRSGGWVRLERRPGGHAHRWGWLSLAEGNLSLGLGQKADKSDCGK
jgi:hypothetical protein